MKRTAMMIALCLIAWAGIIVLGLLMATEHFCYMLRSKVTGEKIQ